MRIAYVIGTFSAHPVVMGAMNQFLSWVTEPGRETEYEDMNQRCAEWVRSTNARLADERCPFVSCTWERSGPCSSASQVATTGSSSTTCAPRA